MPTVAVARRAMNTRFEVVLHGADPVALRAAADQALHEVERLEAQLSLFLPTSEIARVNRRAAIEPVRVSPPVFGLLRKAQDLSAATQGAFDPTVAPMLRAWGFLGGRGLVATKGDLAAACELVGMRHVELDDGASTVRFLRAGMMLDLGAIGKGHAIDCAVEVLRDTGVENAFIHGGTSSCYALGTAEAGSHWRVAINEPTGGDHLTPGLAEPASQRLVPDHGDRPQSGSPIGNEGSGTVMPTALATVVLHNESLGVSAMGSKAFQHGGQTYGHVIDPRSGIPVQAALLAAVALPSATDTDALSTALITLGTAGLPLLRQLHPRGRFLLVEAGLAPGENRVHRSGFDGDPGTATLF